MVNAKNGSEGENITMDWLHRKSYKFLKINRRVNF